MHRARCHQLSARLLATLLLALAGGVAASLTTVASGAARPTCHGRPATVVGTPGRDCVDATEVHNGDVFVLLGGRDDVVDNARNVTVCGGAGTDSISAGGKASGQRTLFDGGDGIDYLISGLTRPGFFHGPRAPLRLFGGSGHDELTGGTKADTIDGGPGPDLEWGIFGDDLLRGGSGDDSLHGQGNGDLMIGGSGDDVLKGDIPQEPAGRDVADGGSDRDLCRAEVKRHCEV
jgi:Ca2+-binding RTX toxin-like protein